MNKRVIPAACILRITLSVWQRNALPLTVVSLLFSAPLVPIGLAKGFTGRVYVLANGLLGLLASGAICAGVVTALRGSRPRVGEMTAAAIGRSGSLLLASLTSGLAVILGLLLLVVPGAIIWAGLFVVVPVIVVEPVGPVEALQRSWELTRGRDLLFALIASVFFSVYGSAYHALRVEKERLVPAEPATVLETKPVGPRASFGDGP